jgi:hypothetical protein
MRLWITLLSNCYQNYLGVGLGSCIVLFVDGNTGYERGSKCVKFAVKKQLASILDGSNMITESNS